VDYLLGSLDKPISTSLGKLIPTFFFWGGGGVKLTCLYLETWEETIRRDVKDWSIPRDLSLDRSAWKAAIHVPEP